MINRKLYNPTPSGRLARFYRRLQSRNVFIFVMALSAVCIFLPRWMTGPAEKVCQAWLAPGGRLMLLAARKAVPRAVPAEPEQGLSNEQMLRMFTTLSLKLQELKHENETLIGLRQAMGTRPVLIPARVVGFDSFGLPSVEIDRGTDSGVKEELPVLATIPLDVLRTQNLDPELGLAAGALVGTIDFKPGPYTSRVKLLGALKLNDRIYARVVRFTQGKTEVIVPSILLEGTAKGTRIKGQTDNSTLLAGMVPTHWGVKSGDMVVPRDPEKLNLPVPLVMGVVEKVAINTESQLNVDLVIRPMVQKLHLNKVYVLGTRPNNE